MQSARILVKFTGFGRMGLNQVWREFKERERDEDKDVERETVCLCMYAHVALCKHNSALCFCCTDGRGMNWWEIYEVLCH